MQVHFTNILNCQIAFYKLGNPHGKPIFFFHPSPRSSQLVLPFAQLLTKQFCVYCIDLPGYGLSQALPEPVINLQSYTKYIYPLIQECVGNKPFSIYGTATGAQLGITLANEHPQQIEHLFLDNAAIFTDEERAEIMQHYFIDLEDCIKNNKQDIIWQMVTNSFLYFPWFKQTEENRIASALPPLPVLYSFISDIYKAGNNYAVAYKAAFANEKAEHILQIKCATTIFKWLNSPILPYISRLHELQLPANIKIIETPVVMQDRYVCMQQIFEKILL
jgi:pimeloyl-ACP methyl ester carboxylesterase